MSERAYALQVLLDVRALFAAPSDWCQGTWAQDADGADVLLIDPMATSWSLTGAVACVGYRRGSRGTNAATFLLERDCGCDLQSFNDAPDRTYDDVIDLLDRTIAKLAEGVSAVDCDKSGG